MARPNDALSRERRKLEDIIAEQNDGIDLMRFVLTRMVNAARTAPEHENIVDLVQARTHFETVIADLAKFHPNRLEE